MKITVEMEKMKAKFTAALPPRPSSSTRLNPKFNNHGGALPEKRQPTFATEVAWYWNKYPNIDASRCKRLLSNKYSAARARIRRLQYIHDMETKVKSFEIEKAQLYSKILVVQKQKELMEAENYFIKQRLCAIEKENAIKEEMVDISNAEVSWLTQFFENQKQQQKEE